MSEPVGETQRSVGSFVRENLALFGWGDAIVAGIILLIGSVVVHETRGIEPSSPYATSLFYALTNIAQVVAPIFAVAFGAGIWLSRRSGLSRYLRKGIILLFFVLSISLLLLPFVDSLYELTGIWQGIVTCLILIALWGVGGVLGELRIEN